MEYLYYAAPAGIVLVVSCAIFFAILRKKSKTASNEIEQLSNGLIEAKESSLKKDKRIEELERYEGISDVDAEIEAKRREFKEQHEKVVAQLKEKIEGIKHKLALKEQELGDRKKQIYQEAEKAAAKIERQKQEATEQAKTLVREANQTKDRILSTSNEQAAKNSGPCREKS